MAVELSPSTAAAVEAAEMRRGRFFSSSRPRLVVGLHVLQCTEHSAVALEACTEAQHPDPVALLCAHLQPGRTTLLLNTDHQEGFGNLQQALQGTRQWQPSIRCACIPTV